MNHMQEKSDHDLLIALNTKFDNLSQDVKEWNDGMRIRVRESEIEIQKIKTIIDKVSPLETYKDFLSLKEKVNRIIWIGAGISIVISFVFYNFNFLLNLLPIRR